MNHIKKNTDNGTRIWGRHTRTKNEFNILWIQFNQNSPLPPSPLIATEIPMLLIWYNFHIFFFFVWFASDDDDQCTTRVHKIKFHFLKCHFLPPVYRATRILYSTGCFVIGGAVAAAFLPHSQHFKYWISISNGNNSQKCQKLNFVHTKNQPKNGM